MSADIADTAGESLKVAPETLVLRARPAPAIRLRRSLIIALAGGGSVALAAVAWMALRPGSLHVRTAQNLPPAEALPAEATLGALARSYGDVPKLGPPLPGDLGRPIVEQQHAMAREPEAIEGSSPLRANDVVADTALSERRAARESGLLALSVSPAGATAGAIAAPPPMPAPQENGRLALDAQQDPNAQQRKADFFATPDPDDPVNGGRLSAAPSPNMLLAGAVIPASLVTGLRSDLPGVVVAQVTERVFDSATGKILLIPQGARLIGRYDSVIAFGQRRALVIWQRIVLPDGQSIALDNAPATDPAGYAGLADKVDFHTWSLLKGVAVSTLLGVGANLTLAGESDIVRAIREATQQNVSRAGDQITARNLQVQPTITIRPGAPVRLLVHRDLILAPWRG